jgi:hypothetical protein
MKKQRKARARLCGEPGCPTITLNGRCSKHRVIAMHHQDSRACYAPLRRTKQ